MIQSEKLDKARKFLGETTLKNRAGHALATFFISVSNGTERAIVVHATGTNIEDAWEKAVRRLRSYTELQGRWIRVEWPDAIEKTTWGNLKLQLKNTKRNYFRYGIALDENFDVAFLEQELNGNAMLYGGNAFHHAVLNEKNFSIYARSRYGNDVSLNFADDAEILVFSTRGFFLDEDGNHYELDDTGLNTGRRKIDPLQCVDVEHIVGTSSAYLARQVQNDGAFVYGFHPCFDREIAAYNALRHASSTYAMIEAWELTRDLDLKQAIDRAIDYLVSSLIKPASLPDGTAAAFLVEQNGEIKLGGNAVCILALTKYSQATGSNDYHALLEKLATGILYMQNPDTGVFVHVLSYPDLAVKEAFRIIYYEGEAAFGLMRLYELTGDKRWLNAVEKAFEHFIRSEYWKWHDHWLAYCVNELTRYRPDLRYFAFGIKNFSTHLDFVLERITTFPTLLELMMAAQQMLHRIGEDPNLHHLLDDVDLDKFYRALHHRANYMLNGYFWPEMAMYFSNPNKIVGSCFIRHHAFRIRIDDVEHYLSGFVGYLKFLKSGAPQTQRTNKTRVWSADEVACATHGSWIKPPAYGWHATGLSIHTSTFQSGQMVVLRNKTGKGIPLQQIKTLPDKPTAILAAADIIPATGFDVPILEVSDTDEAIFALGAWARNRFHGKVLGVTGSAGKTTTVAMLAHALTAYGQVAQSAHNANLPHGIAWNLASMDRNTDYMVLEMAVGRMGQSAHLARPHIAIFTNIQPVHLNENSTVKDIARTKAAIFKGMRQGDTAILNRDMLEWEIVHTAAQRAGLKIVHYGSHEDCAYRLLDYYPDKKLVHAHSPFGELCYRVEAPGRHMALNSLAVLAGVAAVEGDIAPALATFDSFKALPGRGEDMELDLNGKTLKIIDDAYNANPGSMVAALERLHLEPTKGRRVAVLGQMAELGLLEADYHAELARQINERQIDKIYAVGSLYAPVWKELRPEKRATHADQIDQLKPLLLAELNAGDTVLFKGSNSTRMHELVGWLKEMAAGQESMDIPHGTSALFFDGEGDRVSFSTGDDLLHKPASLTKLLTLCLVSDRLDALGIDPDTQLVIPDGVRETNSWWGFEPGERTSIETLMRASIIVSANEASNVLAEWHSDTRRSFTGQLNDRAKKIGMRHTIFSSPSGLGANQQTTLSDTLILARYLHDHYPRIVAMSGERSFLWKGQNHRNTNRLLAKIDGAVGLKTGSLNRTINNLVFSREKNGKLSIAIVLGAPDKNIRDRIVETMMSTFN